MASFSQTRLVHMRERSAKRYLRKYLEKEVTDETLQHLVDTITNSTALFYPFTIPIRLQRCYNMSNLLVDFVLHHHKKALNFAREIIFGHVCTLCQDVNQIAVRFLYDDLPKYREYHVESNDRKSHLLSRTNLVRVCGTIIASSPVLPYTRGMKYICKSVFCQLNNRNRSQYDLYDIKPFDEDNEREILCKGCDCILTEVVNERWMSEKTLVLLEIHDPVQSLLALNHLEADTLMTRRHTIIIRNDFAQNIRIGAKYECICYSISNNNDENVFFEAVQCEEIDPNQSYSRSTVPNSVLSLHNNFIPHYPYSFINILTSLFCPHIQLAHHCTHLKTGLLLSLVSSKLHILAVGSESRIGDILLQTALKYAHYSVEHHTQFPLILAPLSKKIKSPFIVSAGSIALGSDGITYLNSLDKLTKPQLKQLLAALESETLTIEVNKSEQAKKFVYSIPLRTNIWAYHDSRLWLSSEKLSTPTNDIPPAIATAFSLVLPIDEIEQDYENIIDNYLEEKLENCDKDKQFDKEIVELIDNLKMFLNHIRMMEMYVSEEAEILLKKYFCACRRTGRTLWSTTELPATTTEVLTQLCESVAKCNLHNEAIESDVIQAIYMFEISTMTRLGCENLVHYQYRMVPVLTNPNMMIDNEERMIAFGRDLISFCDQYGPDQSFHEHI